MKDEKFTPTEIDELQNLVEVEDINAVSKSEANAKIVGVQSVKKTYICISCKRRLDGYDKSEKVRCKACGTECLTSELPFTWSVRVHFRNWKRIKFFTLD